MSLYAPEDKYARYNVDMVAFSWRGLAVVAMCAAGCAVGVNETGDILDGGGMGGIGGIGGMGPATTTSAATGGMGGEMPMGGMGGEGGEMTNCVFDSPNACSTAEGLGQIAGDENDPVVTRYGVTSKWFQIHITEEVDSIIGEDMSYTVTLTSAPGTMYDLIVHQGPQDGSPNCNATAKVGTPAGGSIQTVHDSWDDDQGIGGEDDSVWLSIEVRYISGSECDTAAEWKLEIQGHT